PSIGGKGLFTEELEERLRQGKIDGAVHSLKDLPVVDSAGLALGAIPARGDVGDALVVRKGEEAATEAGGGPRQPGILPLHEGAVVGTGSRRRAAQLLAQRPDLRILDIRGNVDTRVRKTLDPAGQYDAVVLAAAGLKRLGLAGHISLTLPFETMLPAPGQGALAVQCRKEADWLAFFGGIDDGNTRAAVTAERAFLAGLGGGCRAPVGALGECGDGEGDSSSLGDGKKARRLRLLGRVSALDGSRQLDAQMDGLYDEAEQIGQCVAELILRKGAQEIIDQISENEAMLDADS
ncbi:MAG: hydroxymethylbilane synthase, partial [Caldilineaceae bacterium]|nr:hydroxymethylbilane synthase [Caldilineaceae bacterium]